MVLLVSIEVFNNDSLLHSTTNSCNCNMFINSIGRYVNHGLQLHAVSVASHITWRILVGFCLSSIIGLPILILLRHRDSFIKS